MAKGVEIEGVYLDPTETFDNVNDLLEFLKGIGIDSRLIRVGQEVGNPNPFLVKYDAEKHKNQSLAGRNAEGKIVFDIMLSIFPDSFKAEIDWLLRQSVRLREDPELAARIETASAARTSINNLEPISGESVSDNSSNAELSGGQDTVDRVNQMLRKRAADSMAKPPKCPTELMEDEVFGMVDLRAKAGRGYALVTVNGQRRIITSQMLEEIAPRSNVMTDIVGQWFVARIGPNNNIAEFYNEEEY